MRLRTPLWPIIIGFSLGTGLMHTIRQLAARFCWALDTLDREMLAAVFTSEPTAST